MKHPIRVTDDDCRMMVKDYRGWDCTAIDPVPAAQAVDKEMGRVAFINRLIKLTIMRAATY